MIDFILSNVTGILAVIVATQAVAQAVVNLTPTPRDDEIVGKVYTVIERIAGIWGDVAKELPGERDDLADLEDDGEA